jgi:hypothetical protein
MFLLLIERTSETHKETVGHHTLLNVKAGGKRSYHYPTTG